MKAPFDLGVGEYCKSDDNCKKGLGCYTHADGKRCNPKPRSQSPGKSVIIVLNALLDIVKMVL